MNLAPLSVSSYQVILGSDQKEYSTSRLSTTAPSISNEFLVMTFDATTNRLSSILDKTTGSVVQISQNLLQYHAAPDYTGQASGAYIFAPGKLETIKQENKTEKIVIFSEPLKIYSIQW